MKNRSRYLLMACLAASVLLLSRCYSDQFEPEPVIIDPVDTISFSMDIVPIFVSSCNLSICHATGAEPPDLTPANAYDEIIMGGYVDTVDPTQSEFYYWLIGDGGREIMPPSGRDQELIDLVLGWMQQGALDN